MSSPRKVASLILLGALYVAVMMGFVFPYLMSQKNDVTPLIFVALAAAHVLAVIFYIFPAKKEVKNDE